MSKMSSFFSEVAVYLELPASLGTWRKLIFGRREWGPWQMEQNPDRHCEPWVQWFYMRDPSLLWDPLRLFYFELFSVSWKWIVLSDHTISVGMMEARVKLRINWTQILGSLKNASVCCLPTDVSWSPQVCSQKMKQITILFHIVWGKDF